MTAKAVPARIAATIRRWPGSSASGAITSIAAPMQLRMSTFRMSCQEPPERSKLQFTTRNR